jgi:hypothetical protein
VLHGRSSALYDYAKSEYGIYQVDDLPPNKANIAVEFVDERSSPRLCVEVGGAVAYDNCGVFLHDTKYHVFRTDFDSARARTWHATCDANFEPRHFDRILEQIIHFQLLKRGKTLCHAASFRSEGKAVLCAGWDQVGKTNLLLHFLGDGASFIGDDWAVIHGGGFVQGLQKRLNLLYHNLEPFPDLLADLTDNTAALLDFVEHARSGDYELNQNVVRVLEDRARMQIPPAELFGEALESDASRIDRALLLKSDPAGEGAVTVETIDHDALVTSLAAILEFELSDILRAYAVFRARSGHRVDLLDLARSGSEAILTSAFADLPAVHQVIVPASCNSHDVYAAVSDLLRRDGGGRAPDHNRSSGQGRSPAAA